MIDCLFHLRNPLLKSKGGLNLPGEKEEEKETSKGVFIPTAHPPKGLIGLGFIFATRLPIYARLGIRS